MQKYHVYFNVCFYDYNSFYETFPMKFLSFKYQYIKKKEFRDS